MYFLSRELVSSKIFFHIYIFVQIGVKIEVTYLYQNDSTTDVITSSGYPGNYTDSLDASWFIQIPQGQVIKINFIDFDIDSLIDKNCGR